MFSPLEFICRYSLEWMRSPVNECVHLPIPVNRRNRHFSTIRGYFKGLVLTRGSPKRLHGHLRDTPLTSGLQNQPQFRGQRVQGVGLADHLDAGIENAIIHDGVSRVAGGE